MIKCFSSSTLLLLQNKHNLSDKCVLGLVCLPFSIAKVWELHRNLDIAILYLGFLTKYRWHHNARDGVSHHRRPECLFNCLFRRSSTKTPRYWLCERNLSVTDGFPSQTVSNAENVSIWRRHHKLLQGYKMYPYLLPVANIQAVYHKLANEHIFPYKCFFLCTHGCETPVVANQVRNSM